jgi:hypothetical protein
MKKISLMFALCAIVMISCDKQIQENLSTDNQINSKSAVISGVNKVTIFNENLKVSNNEFGVYTGDFESTRFSSGKISLLIDTEANLASITMGTELYKSLRTELTDVEIILSMSLDDWLDGLDKCGEKSTNAGVIACAGALTIRAFQDCFDATADDAHIHCW